MPETKKIGVVGDASISSAFKGLGFDSVLADDTSDIVTILKNMIDSGLYAIIYVTDELLIRTGEYIDEIKSLTLPAIVPISTGKGYRSQGSIALSDAVRRAVGFDILSNVDKEKK